MNKIKCVNTKGYKLTLGNEYDVIKKEDGYIFIVNDNGKTARYDNSLFSDVEEVVEETIQTIARTEQDCVDSIYAEGNDVFYIDTNGDVKKLTNYYSGSASSISCGILQVSGIDDTTDAIYDLVDQSEEDMIKLAKALFKTATLNYLKKTDNYGMYILSSTVDFDDNFKEVLDDICHFNTEDVENPNSGNIIKMWGFYKNEL